MAHLAALTLTAAPSSPFTLDSPKRRIVQQQLEQCGFSIVRTKGSHQVFKMHGKGLPIVVPSHSNIPLGTLKSIESQARMALSSVAL